jgi:tripartite-type tricarboxylate transporter receptor subunit TctC
MISKKVRVVFVGMLMAIFSCMMLCGERSEAQEKRYPNKAIQVVIPFPAGGPTDQAARILINELTKEMGVTLSVEYKAGAGGVVGTSFVSTAKPDGYTLLCTAAGPIIGSPVMDKECTYDPLKDLTPIAYFSISPNILAGHTSSKLTSFEDVVKFAKEKPGGLTCATSGVGTTSHFMLEVMKMYGVDITHVPAKGAAPSLTNVLGKHVDFVILLYPPLLPHVKSGELRLLVATNKLAQEPQLPTMGQKGMLEGEALGAWNGFFAPPNLPKPVFDQLNSSFRKVMQTPSVLAALEKAGFTAEYFGPEDFKKRIERDYHVMEKIAKSVGLAR